MITKEIKFLLTHSSIYGLGTVVTQLVSFLLLPLYTRYLTPSDYGVLEAISVSSGIIGIVITVGIARALSRFYYISEEETERNSVISTTYITYSLISLFSLPFLIYLSTPLSRILFKTEAYGYFFIISLITLIPGTMIDIGMMYLRLIKKSFIFVSITITRLTFLIVLNIFFIVYLKMGILGILYSSLIVCLLYATFMTLFILWKTKVSFSMGISRQILAYGLPMIFSNTGNTLVKQTDKYFVLYFISVADLGIYSIALKIGNAIHNLITIPFNLAYIPRRFEIMNRSDAKEIYSRIFTYYIFVVVYIGLALSMLIPEILKIMVTPEFLRAKEIIPLVVFSMIIFGCHYHFDFGILRSKKTKYLAYISIASGIAQILLNIILIRLYGIYGAVWSSIIALGLQAILLYATSEKLYPIAFEFKRIFKYLVLSLLFYGIATQMRTDMLLISIGIKMLLLALFPLSAVILKIIYPEEKIKMKEIIINKIKSHIFNKAIVKTN